MQKEPKPEQVIASEVLALLLDKDLTIQTILEIGPELVEYVVEELAETATEDDIDHERRMFAAMAVCRILTTVPFQPIEIRQITPEQLAEALPTGAQ